MPPIQPCVIVFSDRHDLPFIDTFLAQYPTLPGYVAHEDGSVTARRGPHLNALSSIRADHVVWVGVPSQWAAKKVGSNDLFRSHYVDASRNGRFVKTTNSVMINRTVDAALEAITVKAACDAAQATEQAQVAVQEQRRRRLGEEAPWHIPNWLR